MACVWLIALSALVAWGEVREDLGVPVFPGAEPQAQVARAVEAYYRPGVGTAQSLTAGVFETPAPFQKVYEFYGPHMDPGKWGWRRKTRVLLQQTETLKFMRAQLQARHEREKTPIPGVLRPLFGDPGMDQEEFSARLAELLKANGKAALEVVEGTRTLPGSHPRTQVRVTVERPYLDVERMKLVDKTRILVVRVSERPAGQD